MWVLRERGRVRIARAQAAPLWCTAPSVFHATVGLLPHRRLIPADKLVPLRAVRGEEYRRQLLVLSESRFRGRLRRVV